MKKTNNKKFGYVEPDGYIPKEVLKKLGLDKTTKNSSKTTKKKVRKSK